MALMKKLQTGETLHAWSFGDGEDEKRGFTGIALGIFDKTKHLTKPCVCIETTPTGKKQIVIYSALAKKQGFEIVIQAENSF